MRRLLTFPVWLILAAFTLAGATACNRSGAVGPEAKADEDKPKKAKTPRPFARLFVQDLETCSLRWADLKVGEKDEFALGSFAPVEGFKKLDPAKQKLVQMKVSGGLVCLGVRDDEDGASESGWVLVRSGVGYIDHGDHGHWTFKKKPEVVDSRLDKKQGNPAHLYLYDGRFFLANDKLNGRTRAASMSHPSPGRRRASRGTRSICPRAASTVPSPTRARCSSRRRTASAGSRPTRA